VRHPRPDLLDPPAPDVAVTVVVTGTVTVVVTVAVIAVAGAGVCPAIERRSILRSRVRATEGP
jgi:hypothetical protein